MESYEALSIAINRGTVRQAKALHLHTSTVNKWQEPSTDFNDSGAFNPLDRIETIIKTSMEMGNPHEAAFAPIQFLAQRFNLCVIPLPPSCASLPEIIKQIHTTTREFAGLISVSSDALDDGRISQNERRDIDRAGMELLSSVTMLMQLIQKAAK